MRGIPKQFLSFVTFCLLLWSHTQSKTVLEHIKETDQQLPKTSTKLSPFYEAIINHLKGREIEVGEFLGQGSYAVVGKAKQKQNGGERDIAIKLMLASSEFCNEVLSTRRLQEYKVSYVQPMVFFEGIKVIDLQ